MTESKIHPPQQQAHRRKLGIIGSGSWATALVKILTDKGHDINWWIRNEATAAFIGNRHHNPHYLTAVVLNTSLLHIHTSLEQVVNDSEILVIAIPSAYTAETFLQLTPALLKNKIILSAVKGILPEENLLLHEFLEKHFRFPLQQYFALLGPCHAEEVAAEKLSYLTFSGLDRERTKELAGYFKSAAINTVENPDILGVQYAAVLKNIYALGAGIAHGLDYGDNFQSVLIANSADEMAAFLRRYGAIHIVVGEHHNEQEPKYSNYAASVYLGDLLVTCYSLHSRNRMFGNMIGKGYSVKAAQLELSMVAEGYNAARCIYKKNREIGSEMPIAETIYKILWEGLSPEKGFAFIESVLE